jgi:hypothetical protein
MKGIYKLGIVLLLLTIATASAMTQIGDNILATWVNATYFNGTWMGTPIDLNNTNQISLTNLNSYGGSASIMTCGLSCHTWANATAANSGKYLQSNGSGSEVWAQPGPASVQILTAASGTYTTPAGVKAIMVELVGGGGGSGGIAASGTTNQYGCAGGGGGGGAYTRELIVSPAASYAYTVGAAGTAGISGGTAPGGSGGTTQFNGAAITAPGGSGGQGDSTPTLGSVALGGAGGVAGAGGDFMATGGAGGAGFESRYFVIGGQGGNSIYGGGAPSPMVLTQGKSVGTDGNAYGGGASGPVDITTGTNQAANAGAAGAAGVIIVTEYK